jgi:two-component system phosphate regulon sensor histidine kinase PhoR
MTDDALKKAELAYAQARAYGKDVARLYASEKDRRKELETTTQKLQAIFDTAPNGLAVIDDNLNIIEANPRFLALLQQGAECIGQPLGNILPTVGLLNAMQHVREESLELGVVEIEIDEPVIRTLLVNLSPLNNEQGWVLILHDLTERKRLEGLKDEFVNIAAHELRTPLAGVMGFVGVLQEELGQSDDPMMVNLTTLILQSTERLRDTIDELVEFASISRSSSQNMHIAEVDMTRLLQKSVNMLQHKMEAENIGCTLELPAQDLMVRGDHFILDGIIYQLLSNAIKFNRSGGKVFVRARQVEAAGAISHGLYAGTTIIEIEDTGIGIPKTDLDKVFDKFYQVEEHLTRGIGGLGLGLTIAKRGVEQHGGLLTVSSQFGVGSTFRIILPPLKELNEVSIDNRLDMAHRQMLTYARDMARAVSLERKMSRKMERINALSANLAALSAEFDAGAAPLQEIVAELAQLSGPDTT